MSNPKEHPDPILSGKICQYCNNPTRYTDSSVIYNGTSYGMVYYCQPCDAYCGVHRGTNISKGSVAKKDLRDLRKRTHAFFDKIWPQHMSRSKAYTWLRNYLEIPHDRCHIGMFTEKQCTDAIEGCRQFLNDMRRLDMDFGDKNPPPYIQPEAKFPWEN